MQKHIYSFILIAFLYAFSIAVDALQKEPFLSYEIINNLSENPKKLESVLQDVLKRGFKLMVCNQQKKWVLLKEFLPDKIDFFGIIPGRSYYIYCLKDNSAPDSKGKKSLLPLYHVAKAQKELEVHCFSNPEAPDKYSTYKKPLAKLSADGRMVILPEVGTQYATLANFGKCGSALHSRDGYNLLYADYKIGLQERLIQHVMKRLSEAYRQLRIAQECSQKDKSSCCEKSIERYESTVKLLTKYPIHKSIILDHTSDTLTGVSEKDKGRPFVWHLKLDVPIVSLLKYVGYNPAIECAPCMIQASER